MAWGNAARIVAQEAEDQQVLLHFAGHVFEPLLSGALFWREQSMLLVADLHLEKFSSFAKRGHMLPPYDTGLTLKRLERDLERTGAERVVSLGDSFHRDEGTATLLDADRLRLMALLEHLGLTLTHEPRRGARGVIAGHLHPAAAVYSNGSATRRPCFVHDGKILLLPAYGSGAGSMNILGPTFAGLFNHRALEVTMIGRSRLYPVSTKRLVGGI
jgi:metallophosphoesterase superfamily enzyme